MARFNEILVGRYNRLLQKLFQVKGTAPVPVLSTEIQPQISLFTGSELRYLEGWDLFGFAIAFGATVGQVNSFRLRNPLGSSVIGIVEQVWISAGIAEEIDLSYTGPAGADVNLANLQSSVSLESRGRFLSTLIVSTQAAAGGGGAAIFHRFQLPLNQTFEVLNRSEIVLPPSSRLDIQTSVANNTSIVAIRWRERFLEESERT